MANSGPGEKPRALVPKTLPREGREIAESIEFQLERYARQVIVQAFDARSQNLDADRLAMMRSIQEVLREKTFDYFRRRLGGADITAIRAEHKKAVHGLSVQNPVEKDEIMRLDQERQKKIMEKISEEFDPLSLVDEVKMRFPRDAKPRALFRAFLNIRSMSIEDILQAHANREYTVSDEELERLKTLPQPVLMFDGQIFAQGPDGETYTLVHLTNPDHLVQESHYLKHCINDEDGDYRSDILARLQDGTMKSACFSLRIHEAGTDLMTDPGVSVWTIWYDRESETIQQIKGLRNRVITATDTIEELAVLRAIARFLTDADAKKRFPVNNIKDLEKLKLDTGRFLIAKPIGEISTKSFDDLTEDDVIITGKLELTASFSDSTIQKVVQMRGVRVGVTALPEEKRRVYVDALLQASRRDLATEYLKLWEPDIDLFSSRYRFREVLLCSADTVFAMRICLRLWRDISKIDDADANLLIKLITDPNRVYISLNLLKFADSRIKPLTDKFITPIIQSACKAINPDNLTDYIYDLPGTVLKGIGIRNIDLLADTLANAPDARPSIKALSLFNSSFLRAFGRKNIRKFVDAVIGKSDHASIRLLVNNIVIQNKENYIGTTNLKLLREAGHNEP